jgi:hypothetical protein
MKILPQLPHKLQIFIIVLFLLLLAIPVQAAPSNPFWWTGELFPGYATDCLDYCEYLQAMDDHIDWVFVVANNGQIVRVTFQTENTLVYDLRWLWGEEDYRGQVIGIEYLLWNNAQMSGHSFQITALLDGEGMVSEVTVIEAANNGA